MVWMKPRVPAGRAGGGGRLRSQHGAAQGPGSQRHHERPSPSSPLCPGHCLWRQRCLGAVRPSHEHPGPCQLWCPWQNRHQHPSQPNPACTTGTPKLPPLPGEGCGSSGRSDHGAVLQAARCRSVTAPTPQREPRRAVAIPAALRGAVCAQHTLTSLRVSAAPIPHG